MIFLATPLPWVGDVGTLLAALLAGLTVFGLLYASRWFLRRRLNEVRDRLVLECLARLHRPTLLVFAITVSVRMLPLPEAVTTLAHQVQWLTVAVQTAIWVDILSLAIARSLTQSLSEGRYHLPGLQLGIKMALLALLAITTLDNLGVNISSLLTGLGIGGIAIALAAQRVIGDLLSTATIAMDRPFVEGDFIAVGDISGQVLQIGLKTTRLKSPSGEELIVPNADLVTLRVKNHSRIERKTTTLKVPVSWATNAAQLEAIPGQLKALIVELPDLEFGYAYLISAEHGYTFEVSYTLKDPTLHLPMQEAVLLKVAALLEREGISPQRPWMEGQTPSPAP